MCIMGERPTEYISVEIAGIKFEIECVDRRSYSIFKHYLTHFERADYTISVSKAEIDKKRRVISFINEGSLSSITTDSDLIIEQSIIHEKIASVLANNNILLMHGAVVAKNGFAYMFSADSGVGKTTRAKIWIQQYPDSIIVNGDKPFIKINSDNVQACGAPWCGKEGWNTNITLPLRAIFLIERAADNETRIEEISLGKALPYLLKQTFIPNEPNAMIKIIENLKQLEGKIRICKLCSPPTPDAIHMAYEFVCPGDVYDESPKVHV